jgi:RNA polymerase sigma-70 factor (ECF subfamily)
MGGGAREDAEVFSFRRGGARHETVQAEALLVRSGRGDEEAFAAFYDMVIDRVFGLIRSVLRDPARSEEVAQEVMLELWRTAPRFSPERGSASAWALTIAHRRAVDRVRSEVASRARDEGAAERDVTLPEHDVAVVVETRLEGERVARALAELTPTQRESVELAFFGGYSHSEVAATLDLPLGTVKTRIRDGLIRLRDRLEVSS